MSDANALTGAGYGRTVALSGEPECLAAAAEHLPFWWQDGPGPADEVFEVATPAAAPLVVREMEHWLAEHAVGVVFVHAAAVALAGRVLLLPGRSFSGKSTLCAELLRQGATYLSDEYAVLDDAGRVHPYPRPLQLRDGAAPTPTSAASLGATIADGPLPVGVVATLQHLVDGAWDVVDVGPGQAVLDLLDNTVAARSRPEAALDAVTAALASSPDRPPARCLRGTRGDATDAAPTLLALLA